MLSGHEKAKLLLELLGDKAPSVLSQLKPEYAQAITSQVEDAPMVDQDYTLSFIDEVVKAHSQYKPAIPQFDLSTPSEDLEFQPSGNLDELSLEVPDSHSDLLDSPTFEESQQAEGNDAEIVQPSTPVENMARVLAKQKPKIVAFFLSHLPEPDRTMVWANLPEAVQRAAKDIKVEDVPASKAMFDQIHEMILNDPDFSAGNFVEPEGLDQAIQEIAVADVEAGDILQSSVEQLSNELASGAGFKVEDDPDEDDEPDEDEDEVAAAIAALQGEHVPAVSGREDDVLNLSLSEGIETIDFPVESIDEPLVESQPTEVVGEAPVLKEERPSSSEQNSSSFDQMAITNDIADEDLLGPDI